MKVVCRKGWVKIQQMYENLELDLELKLLFMVSGTFYESGLLYVDSQFKSWEVVRFFKIFFNKTRVCIY